MLSGSEALRLLNAILNTAWTTDKRSSAAEGDKLNPANATSSASVYSTSFKTRWWLGFFTAAPTVDANGNVTSYSEPTGGDYARQELTEIGLIEQKVLVWDPTGTTPTVSDAETRKVAMVSNTNENIMFPYTGESGSGYGGSITHFGLFTSASGGTPLFYGPLEASVSVPANVLPIVLKGKFKVTLG